MGGTAALRSVKKKIPESYSSTATKIYANDMKISKSLNHWASLKL